MDVMSYFPFLFDDDIDIMVNNYLLIYKQNYKPRTNTTA